MANVLRLIFAYAVGGESRTTCTGNCADVPSALILNGLGVINKQVLPETYNAPYVFLRPSPQNLKTLSRRYEAEVDWAAFEELYRRRAEGEDIKASRDLQRNFQHPETELERKTATHIAQYLHAKRTEWQTMRGLQLGSMWRFRASDIDRWISERLAG